MPKEAFDHDEIYEEARKACNKENVDYSLNMLHALAFEAEYDRRLTTRYDPIPAFGRHQLFSDEQRARVLQVLSPNEMIDIDHTYRDVLIRLDKEIALANDVRIDANRRAVFINQVAKTLQSMQSYVANAERVIARLEHEIESLELAIAFDQERACF